MAFTVDPVIWRQFPGMLLVVAYAEGVQNHSTNQRLQTDIEALHERTRREWQHGNAQSHPAIAAWRTATRDVMGLSSRDYPSSIEALMKRVLGGKGIASINPLVDFYNLASIAHVVPVGGWDVDDLAGDIALRRTRGGELFRPLGAGKEERVESGEVCYADAEEIVTRHFIWRQSERGKVGPSTRRVFLVSEVLREVGAAAAEATRDAFTDGLRTYFGVTTQAGVLAAGDDSWNFNSRSEQHGGER